MKMKLKNEVLDKTFILRKKLFIKSLYAACIFTFILFGLAILGFLSAFYVIATIALIVAMMQATLELYLWFKINANQANNATLNRLKKSFIIMFLLCNILGGLYLMLLVKKSK